MVDIFFISLLKKPNPIKGRDVEKLQPILCFINYHFILQRLQVNGIMQLPLIRVWNSVLHCTSSAPHKKQYVFSIIKIRLQNVE